MGGYNAAGQPAPLNWNGPYLGVTAGYTGTTFDASNIFLYDDPLGTPSVPSDFGGTDAFSFTGNGAIGGLEGGVNVQAGTFVFGVEADYSWTGSNGSYTGTTNFVETGRLKSLATVRGRVGAAVGRALIFGTAGFAVGSVESQIDDTYAGPTVITTTDRQTHTGWTAGGGAEVALTNRLSIKGEALYYDLGTQTYSFSEADPPGWALITADARVTGWLGRVGLNVHF
jgi:outer membrane immunogenic protein